MQQGKFIQFVIFGAAGVILLLMAASSALWSVYCFLGGPDGNRGSRESLSMGSYFLTFAVGVGPVAMSLIKLARKKRLRG